MPVLPPTDSNVSGGVFSSCQYTAPPGNSTGPPWGTFSATVVGLQDHQRQQPGSPNFNGQWVTWQIPIPINYTCDSASRDRLLGTAAVRVPDGTSVQDTTTWSAYILGEPVRIIQ